MNRLRSMLASVALCAVLTSAAATNGFAIFVDSASYVQATPELKAYAESVDRQGLVSEIVVVNSGVTPDSLRKVISAMSVRKQAPIEGMVFVGDIPVPMLLDAQHLTSAFKVVQNMKRLATSACPSDRFYDDLNLKFDFIGQDQQKPLLYYYSMRPDSPQKTAPQLYSGRIKSIDFNGKDKYTNLRDYLKKVVRVKNSNEQFEQMLFFSGSGYNSESPLSRIDEKVAHLEQFPWMKNQPSALTYLDHKSAEFAKYALMSQMQRPDLSLALLHHHGSPVKEYINRYPDARNVRTQLDQAQLFFRGKIRNAVDAGTPLDSAIARYARDYDVPEWWFKNVLDSASVAADSIYNDRLDLHLHDFEKYTPNARVVMLDACFNGSFNNDKYIAGAYVFGDGDCVAVIANSVNSLQDKWCDKYLGMLGLGMRVGNMVKYNPYLESHVIGDPTFAFVPRDKQMFDVNKALHESSKFWKKQLKSDYPVVKALALEMLSRDGELTPAQLLEQYRQSDDFLPRLSALMLLSQTQSPEFVEVIKLGLTDSYELIRRFSAVFAGKNGSPELIPYVVRSYADGQKGERVNFQLQNAMPLFSYEEIVAELDRQRPYRHAYDEADMMNKAKDAIADRFSNKRYADNIEMLKSDKPNIREVKAFVRQLRNNPLHPSVDNLFDYLYVCQDADVQKLLVEAFGWFNYSYRAPEIAKRMEGVASDNRFSAPVRDEARKTVARLTGK